MPQKSFRLGVTALATALAALAAAGPASAAVTTSKITSPASPYFAYRDYTPGAPASQPFTVTGTTDGTTGDTVDIYCYQGSSAGSPLNTAPIPVNADGSFSGQAEKTTDEACSLRAVPTGGVSSGDLPDFAGVSAAFGYLSLGTTDFDIDTYTLKAGNYLYSATNCALCYSQLFDASFVSYQGPWDAVGALYPSVGTGSQIKVDGHNAYAPYGAQIINGAAAGLPQLTFTKAFDETTGQWSGTETDELAFCADAAGNIVDKDGPLAGDCPRFVGAGVSLVRDIANPHAGQLTTFGDHWTSTDGKPHALVAQYDNNFYADYVRLPGETAYTAHDAGTSADLGGSAVGTVYVENDQWYAPGAQNAQGSLTYTTAPSRAFFFSADELVLEYSRTIPAGGKVDISHAYAMGFTREEVQALASGVEDANAAPAVAITSPASGTVSTSDAVTVIGTASDNVGVTSLRVDGIPTPVQPDGSWSQRVPLTPGANTVTAVATDGAGQSSQAQVSVVYAPPAAPSCKVPDVVGQPAAAAAAAIGAAGCTVGVTTTVPSKVAKGSVATQSRAGGATLPAYFPIDLKVSSGPVGKAKLATKSVRVKNGAVTLQISCPATSGNVCNGTVKIRTNGKVAGKKRTLGTRAFQAPAGKKRKTTFKLSKANARALKGRTVKTTVFIVYRDEDGKSRTTKAKLTIKG